MSQRWHGACLFHAPVHAVSANRALLGLLLLPGLWLLGACGGGDPLPAGGPDPVAAPSTPPAPDAPPAPGGAPDQGPTPAPPVASQPEPFAGLPVFPGSGLVEIDLGDKESAAIYVADSAVDTVAAFYDRALPEAGWLLRDRAVKADRVEYEVERDDAEGQVRLAALRDGRTQIRLEVQRDG